MTRRKKSRVKRLSKVVKKQKQSIIKTNIKNLNGHTLKISLTRILYEYPWSHLEKLVLEYPLRTLEKNSEVTCTGN